MTEAFPSVSSSVKQLTTLLPTEDASEMPGKRSEMRREEAAGQDKSSQSAPGKGSKLSTEFTIRWDERLSFSLLLYIKHNIVYQPQSKATSQFWVSSKEILGEEKNPDQHRAGQLSANTAITKSAAAPRQVLTWKTSTFLSMARQVLLQLEISGICN